MAKITRRQFREHVFCMLFENEFHEREELREQFGLYLDNWEEIEEKERENMVTRTLAVIDRLPQLDEMISECSDGWSLPRMAKVDLTLIRLALYEIRFDDEIPVGVAINEAVELAKQYGGGNSPGFINGVLAKLVK